MMLLNLNTSSVTPYGSLASQKQVVTFTVYSATEQDIGVLYRSEDNVVLAPSEGMTAIQLLGEDGNVASFYLDKAVMLKPQQPFALYPLNGSSKVRINSKTQLVPMEEGVPSPLQPLSDMFSLRQLCTLFFQEHGPEFFFSGEQHSAYELICVTQGQLHVLAGGQEYTLRQHEALVIAPDLWHIQYGEKDQGVAFLVTSFLTEEPLPEKMLLRILPERYRTRELTEMILYESKKQAAYQDDLLVSLLQNLLIRYARFSDGNEDLAVRTPAAVKNDNQVIDRAVQYAAESIFKKSSVQQMARYCGVSTAYLSMLFQAHLGTSPGAYMLRARLEESRNMIRSGAGNMAEIAEQLHFSSAPHFSAAFRRQYGMTPTAYAKGVK